MIKEANDKNNQNSFKHLDKQQGQSYFEWARIHINGKHCIIGHVYNETFYVVFFDRDHRFWISELKHT